MILTLSWLKEHLDTKANLDTIISQLTDIGLEVENIKRTDDNLAKFIVCKIKKVEKHPNADKLKLCDVEIENKNIVKVVCGASNAREDLYTIYAPPGVTIPKTGLKLKVAKIRGVESQGMLCSEFELGISDASEGIIDLKEKKQIGEKYFKGSKDQTIDVAITPNRPDCLGVSGIARDLASSGLGKLKKKKEIKFKQSHKQPVPISITGTKSGCLAFGSCYIRGVNNRESPEWLKNKILSLGLKPISAIVDISNYVMFDQNRPLHAYDADKIKKGIIVRGSKKRESFEALDNKKYVLDQDMCVIADQKGILGLGGIIGGTRSGTEISTKNILLESAYFDSSLIRKTSKNLSIETDAKHRFERGIDPLSIKPGLEKATKLILDICGGEASKFLITGNLPKKKKKIELKMDKFKSVIGIPISISEAKKILMSLGCEVSTGKSQINVVPPSWRLDLKEDIDVIEELIRIHGYGKIKLISPTRERDKNTLNQRQKIINLAQRVVASRGYLQAITWSFSDSKIDNLFSNSIIDIKVANPISSDLNVLRTSIFSNLSINIKRNLDKNYYEPALFEVGPVFYGKKPGQQKIVLGALKSGTVSKKNWIEKERPVDVFDVKDDIIKSLLKLGLEEQDLFLSNKSEKYFHPGKSGSIRLGLANGPLLGYFGEIHPGIIRKLDLKNDNLTGFEIFLENFPLQEKKLREIKNKYFVSDFQKNERDFAFVVDKKINSLELVQAIKKVDENLIHKIKVFDVYEGEKIPEQKKSVALNVMIQAPDRTLKDSDLDNISKKIINTIKEIFGAELRS